MDGVDASIIQSDGETNYKAISNKYFKYNLDFFKRITSLRDKIKRSKDLIGMVDEIKSIETTERYIGEKIFTCSFCLYE